MLSTQPDPLSLLHNVLIHSGKGGGEPVRRLEGRKFTRGVETNNTDKKENKIFLIYKEIQMGSGAKSYMRKCAIFPNI
jgi:hypothetical protein